jgi:DNA invertase Pin-like site-specific DNA recombinase
VVQYVRAYLRASTDQQDASRAREQLKAFARERGLQIVAWYVENESGAKLARPELSRLLADACEGDILYWLVYWRLLVSLSPRRSPLHPRQRRLALTLRWEA